MNQQTWDYIRGAGSVLLAGTALWFAFLAHVRSYRNRGRWWPGLRPAGDFAGAMWLTGIGLLMAERAAFRLPFIHYEPPNWWTAGVIWFAALVGLGAVYRLMRGGLGPGPWNGKHERRNGPPDRRRRT